MAVPRLLIDNDILLLFAGAHLLEPAITALGFRVTDTYQLGTLTYMLNRSKHFRQLPETLKTEIIQGCQPVPVLQTTPNTDVLQQLSDVVEIDDGEALLYGLLAEEPYYLLTTNDKRAMRAVATQPALQMLRRTVTGRIICLETLLLRLIEQEGVAAVAQALMPVVPENTLLRVCFSPGNIAQPLECKSALQHYLHVLTGQVGTDFLWKGV